MKIYQQKIRIVAIFLMMAMVAAGLKLGKVSSVEHVDLAMAASDEARINLNIPFTSQAPSGEWADPVFQNGCEEASILMVIAWIKGQTITVESAKQEIRRISDYEKQVFGTDINTSIEDTARIIREHYGYSNIEIKKNIQVRDIIEELQAGSAVIVPVDGQELANPHYIQPGPPVHMLVLVGYDADTQEFIANDPGTRFGEGYRYGETTLFNSIRDYPTGDYHSFSPSVVAKNILVARKA